MIRNVMKISKETGKCSVRKKFQSRIFVISSKLSDINPLQVFYNKKGKDVLLILFKSDQNTHFYITST